MRDGDPAARALYHRHYSRRYYRDGRKPRKFVGPGEYLVLLSFDGRALWIARKFIDDVDDGTGQRQQGVSCACFRNEGPLLSSALIVEAVALTWRRWPNEQRTYTLVNPAKVRAKRDPGYCFLRAGWRVSGVSRGGLLILEVTKGAT